MSINPAFLILIIIAIVIGLIGRAAEWDLVWLGVLVAIIANLWQRFDRLGRHRDSR